MFAASPSKELEAGCLVCSCSTDSASPASASVIVSLSIAVSPPPAPVSIATGTASPAPISIVKRRKFMMSRGDSSGEAENADLAHPRLQQRDQHEQRLAQPRLHLSQRLHSQRHEQRLAQPRLHLSQRLHSQRHEQRFAQPRLHLSQRLHSQRHEKRLAQPRLHLSQRQRGQRHEQRRAQIRVQNPGCRGLCSCWLSKCTRSTRGIFILRMACAAFNHQFSDTSPVLSPVGFRNSLITSITCSGGNPLPASGLRGVHKPSSSLNARFRMAPSSCHLFPPTLLANSHLGVSRAPGARDGVRPSFVFSFLTEHCASVIAPRTLKHQAIRLLLVTTLSKLLPRCASAHTC